MTVQGHSLGSFLAQHGGVVQIVLTKVRGSSPRNLGTRMFVTADGLRGTIGGGQLEFIVIQRARDMLRDGVLSDQLAVPLGPEIGQCCGGHVDLALTRMSKRDKRNAADRDQAHQARRPHVYILGAGHVGRALAVQLQHLPVRCILVDTRESELAQCTATVETRLSAIPEVDIATAPSGSAFVVLTHDHGLDFLLTSAALERKDAAYVGLIGSATKRARFKSWCRESCDGLTIDQLTCPIGSSGSADKRPSVIASFVVAEIIAKLTSEPAEAEIEPGFDLPDNGLSTRRKIKTAGPTRKT